MRVPAQGALPIVVDSAHSGTGGPADFGDSAPCESVRRGEGLYVARLYARAPDFGATFIAAHFARAYIDLSRLLADIDEALLDASWPGDVAVLPTTKLGIGLIWRLLGEVPIYSRKLSVAEVQRSCYADIERERYAPNDGFARVQRALDVMLAALPAHARGQRRRRAEGLRAHRAHPVGRFAGGRRRVAPDGPGAPQQRALRTRHATGSRRSQRR